MSVNLSAPDLTIHPPRSPRVKLGGYVLLPRMLDKGRAFLAEKNGDYHYHCPLDQRFTSFVGVDADVLLEQIKQGKGDGELLQWINENASIKRTDVEVVQWSAYQATRGPSDVETREFFNKLHAGAGEHREDISTWFDLLDMDDFASYGGKA